MVKQIDANRLWLFADLHFGIRNNSVNWLDLITDAFDNFFIPLIKNNKKEKDVILILGDTFDNRNSINTLTLNSTINTFSKISKIIDIYVLCGNHDLYYKNSNSVSSLKVLEPFCKEIFYEPEQVLVNNKRCLFLPWNTTEHSDNKLINVIYKDCEYIFAHAEISGMKFNNQILIKPESEKIQHEDITSNKKIFSGHIHYRQEVNNTVYVGSPLQFNSGDRDNSRGCYLLDLDTQEHRFFENTKSPKFKTITFREFISMDIDEYLNYIKGNFIDIQIPKKYSNQFPYAKLINISNLCRNLRFNYTDNENDWDKINFMTSTSAFGKPIENVIIEYIEEKFTDQHLEICKKYLNLINEDKKSQMEKF